MQLLTIVTARMKRKHKHTGFLLFIRSTFHWSQEVLKVKKECIYGHLKKEWMVMVSHAQINIESACSEILEKTEISQRMLVK